MAPGRRRTALGVAGVLARTAGHVAARTVAASARTAGAVAAPVATTAIAATSTVLREVGDPELLERARQQVASGLRVLLAPSSDTAERLRYADPTTMARAVLALVGGEEQLLPLPKPDDQIRQRFRALLDPAAAEAAEALAPSLLAITAQLSPDEARVLRHLDREPRVPVVGVEAGSLTSRHGPVVADHLSMVVERAGGDHPGRGAEYVGNLLRLGLVAVDDETMEGHPDHQLIEAGRAFQAAVDQVRAERGRPRVHRRTLRLTALGRQLVAIALHGDGAELTSATDGPPPPPRAALPGPSDRGDDA